MSFQELFALRFAMALVMALRLKHNGFNPIHHACDSMFKLDRSMWRPLGRCSLYPVRLFTSAKSAGYNKTW